jgi:hypothetical protein
MVVVADIEGGDEARDFQVNSGLLAGPGGAGTALERLPGRRANLKPILSIWYPQIINNTTGGVLIDPPRP